MKNILQLLLLKGRRRRRRRRRRGRRGGFALGGRGGAAGLRRVAGGSGRARFGCGARGAAGGGLPAVQTYSQHQAMSRGFELQRCSHSRTNSSQKSGAISLRSDGVSFLVCFRPPRRAARSVTSAASLDGLDVLRCAVLTQLLSCLATSMDSSVEVTGGAAPLPPGVA
eukprot:COSAG06_NODE_30886_length_530_cov_1.707657_1_plen_167_part_10